MTNDGVEILSWLTTISHVYTDIIDISEKTAEPLVWCTEKQASYKSSYYNLNKKIQKRCSGCGMALSS